MTSPMHNLGPRRSPGIALRSAAVAAAALAVGLAALGWPVVRWLQADADRRLAGHLLAPGALIAAGALPESAIEDPAVMRGLAGPDLVEAVVVDGAGVVVRRLGGAGSGDLKRLLGVGAEALAALPPGRPTEIAPRLGPFRVAVTPVAGAAPGARHYVGVRLSTARVSREKSVQAWRLAAGAAFLCGGVALLVWFWTRRQLAAPLARLAEAAHALAESGGQSGIPEVSGPGELARLRAGLEAMVKACRGRVAALSDLVVRLEAAEHHARMESLFRQSIIESTAEGIAVCREIPEPPYVHFTVWNPQLTEITGYTLEEINRGGWYQTLYPDPEVQQRAAERMSRMREGQDLQQEEWEITRKDGVRRQVQISTRRVPSASGVSHVLGLFTDVTERRKAEREIHRLNAELEERVMERTAQLAEANRELEAFCYSVSHDLRAPLRALQGFSHALEEDLAGRLDGTTRQHLERIRANGMRMADLVDDLLALSRVNRAELRLTRVDLSALAVKVASDLTASAPDRAVDWVIPGGLTVEADAGLLRLALENLLGNAWKYTGRRSPARIELGCQARAAGPAYFVRDNGAGFDMKYATRLFGAFQRLHAPAEFEGLGIGLATVKRIIQRHGGRIWGEGQVDRGATFYFTLP